MAITQPFPIFMPWKYNKSSNYRDLIYFLCKLLTVFNTNKYPYKFAFISILTLQVTRSVSCLDSLYNIWWSAGGYIVHFVIYYRYYIVSSDLYTLYFSILCDFAGATKCYDALSSDLLRNTLVSFVQLGIIKARKTWVHYHFSYYVGIFLYFL